MTSKKKLTIAIVSLSLVLFVVIASLVLVFAALNATVKSGITIKYTAKNVDAIVTISYKITGQEEVALYADAERTITALEFSPTDKTGIEKSFQPTGEINIGPTDKIVFTMAITNRHTTDNLYYDVNNLREDYLQRENVYINIGISHTKLANPETDQFLSGDDVDGYIFNDGRDIYTIKPSSTIYCYFRVSIINDVLDAILDAEFDFLLSSTY